MKEVFFRDLAQDAPPYNEEIITFSSDTGKQQFNFYVRMDYTGMDGKVHHTGRFSRDGENVTHWSYKLKDPIKWSVPDEA